MKFSDVAGHEEVKAALRRQADEGRLPHAVLLAGPSGIGKMRLARALAQYLHCSNRQGGDSCGVCPSCRQHESGNNPDMHYVYPVAKTQEREVSEDCIDLWRCMLEDYPYMPVEQWSELQEAGNKQLLINVKEAKKILESASLSPYKEDLKIYIIWLPEKMNTEAANKLLKLIEEPFEDTLFILVSNDSKLILPTIFSRTQPYNMKPLPIAELGHWLEKEEHTDQISAYEAARLGEGRIGAAIGILRGAEENKEFGEYFRGMMRMAYSRQVDGLKQFSDKTGSLNRPKLIRYLEYCTRMVRENFIYNLHKPALNLMTAEEGAFSRKFAPFIHSGNVERMAEEFDKAIRDVSGNANGKMVMFSLSLWLCQLIRTSRPT